MSNKAYIVKDENGKLHLIKKSYRPKNVVGFPPKDPITGEYEDARWLQVENIADPETGELIPTVTVNQVLKDSIKAEEISLKDNEEKQKAADKALKDDLLTRLLAFDETTVKDLNDIKAFMRDIKEYFLFKYREDIKKKKAKV